MEYEKFKELVDLMKCHNKKVCKLYDDFGIDLVDMFNDHSVLVDRFWDLLVEDKVTFLICFSFILFILFDLLMFCLFFQKSHLNHPENQ